MAASWLKAKGFKELLFFDGVYSCIWRMKAWGVYTYALFVVVNQITLITIGLWTISSLAIPVIVVAIGVYYLKDMS